MSRAVAFNLATRWGGPAEFGRGAVAPGEAATSLGWPHARSRLKSQRRGTIRAYSSSKTRLYTPLVEPKGLSSGFIQFDP
jgi:hypothetical protein